MLEWINPERTYSVYLDGDKEPRTEIKVRVLTGSQRDQLEELTAQMTANRDAVDARQAEIIRLQEKLKGSLDECAVDGISKLRAAVARSVAENRRLTRECLALLVARVDQVESPTSEWFERMREADQGELFGKAMGKNYLSDDQKKSSVESSGLPAGPGDSTAESA